MAGLALLALALAVAVAPPLDAARASGAAAGLRSLSDEPVVDATVVYSWADGGLSVTDGPVAPAPLEQTPLAARDDGYSYIGWDRDYGDAGASFHGYVHADLGVLPPDAVVRSARLTYRHELTENPSSGCPETVISASGRILPGGAWADVGELPGPELPPASIEFVESGEAGFPVLEADVTRIVRAFVRSESGADTGFRVEEVQGCPEAVPLLETVGLHMLRDFALTVEYGAAPDSAMVSLGDSYQSGEGAGSAYDDATGYYLHAYENGGNYPAAVGDQENTLTPEATSGVGNGCHRALHNYPKQVAESFADERVIAFVDVTCSGAKIEPGGKPPLVGTNEDGQNGYEVGSQIDQAIDRLDTIGLDRTDVTLVTVGMGGNDAKFADLVTACLAPTLFRRAVEAYEDSPRELRFVADQVTCSRLDSFHFHVSRAIDELAEKERFAQRALRNAFPNADIFQLDYPGLLPEADDAPPWCGGIGPDDIDYAGAQADRINDVLAETVAEAQAENAGLDRYYAPVEVGHAFGANALCPAEAADQLANPILQENFDLEVGRLLGDAEFRPALDEIVAAWRSLRNCIARIGAFCNFQERKTRFSQAKDAILAQFGPGSGQLTTVLANLTKPPSSGEAEETRFDRSIGLFHPNQDGIDVLACFVFGTVRFLGTSQCEPGGDGARSGARTATAPGALTATREPIPVEGAGATVPLSLAGYEPGSTVTVHDGGTELVALPVSAAGVVTGPLTLPAAPPGVQVLSVRGHTATGAAYGHDLRLEYPGAPRFGQDYSVYLEGFDPRATSGTAPWTAEEVEITYLGFPLVVGQADAAGGLLVTVPVPEDWPGEEFELVATGSRSGTVRRVLLEPEPGSGAFGLWATDGDVRLTGASATVDVPVHAEGSVLLTGVGARLTGGVTYVGSANTVGAVTVRPAPRRVSSGTRTPLVAEVAEFRPGAPRAVAAGPAYRAVPRSACTAGVWTPAAAELTGTVYVPCSVSLVGAATSATVTIAAEGDITVLASGLRLRPADQSGAVLVGGAAVRVLADRLALDGPVFAAGPVLFAGDRQRLTCSAVGSSVRVTGIELRVTRGGPCARL